MLNGFPFNQLLDGFEHKTEMKITRNFFVRGKQKSYNKKPITSLNDYLSYVNYLGRYWDVEQLWFRGVSKSKYLLVPSIYRTSDWDFDWQNVREITDEFIRRAASPAPNSSRDLTRWEWYHVMQHHGLPTRLLDWSLGSLIALYFALRDLTSISLAAVWVLDPFWLNSESIQDNVVIITDQVIQSGMDKIAVDYLDYFSEESDAPELPKFPIAIQSSNLTPRIHAQRGCFTAHGWMTDGLSAIYKRSKSPRLVQLRVSDSAAEAIKSELKVAGISEATLFPDLDGLARELRIEYGFREAFRKWSR